MPQTNEMTEHTPKRIHLSSFWRGGGGVRGWNSFIFVSSSCSQSVPNDVPQVFNIFHRLFPIAFYFVSYALANVVLLSPTYMGQRGGILHFKIKPSFFAQG